MKSKPKKKVMGSNFLREFWSTDVAFDPFPSTDKPEKRPLKEFLIKFLVSNGQRPLTFNFKTFCSSADLDYNNGKYVDHPTPEVVKKELGAAVSYADLKASVDQYYDENIAHRDQTDKLVKAFMSSLDRSSATISDLYKGQNVITQLLKEISNVVKDGPATNQKINEATKTFARISSNITEVLSLVKGFDFSALLSIVKSIQVHAIKKEEATTALKREISSLRKDTSEIKSMMIEISQATPKIDKGKRTTTVSDDDPSKKLVKALFIVHPNPDEPVSVEFIINGRTVYLIEQEIQDYWDKEEQIKKAEEEARLNAISKIELIKVVREEANKLGIHPKEAISTKAGELFKKAQDAEHEVLKRQHIEKVRKSLELRKHKAFGISELDELREIIPEKKNTMVKDLMNSLSRRYERLRQIPGELGIQSAFPALEQAPYQTSGRKQKHIELERETKSPGLKCNRTLPENVPFVNNMVIEELEYGIFFTDKFEVEQDQSQSSRRKRKYKELEPEIKVPGLECSRSLPEGVPFIKNMVIEELEYGIFFTDVFGDQAFQR
nr:copia protein [Tanacetum cinerariifolium]